MEHTKKELREFLQGLTGQQFEQFVADLWELQGYETQVTDATSDGGVDVIATGGKNDQRVLIQAKRYAEDRSVGVRALREFLGVSKPSDRRIFVTSSDFTTDARAQAFDTDREIALYTRTDLVHLIRRTESEQLLQRYASAGERRPQQGLLEDFLDKQDQEATKAEQEGDSTETSKSEGIEISAFSNSAKPSLPRHWPTRILAALIAGVTLYWVAYRPLFSASTQELLAAVAILLVWFYPIYAMYRDGRNLGYSYFPSLFWPLLGLFLPIAAPLYYVYRRRSTTSSELNSTT